MKLALAAALGLIASIAAAEPYLVCELSTGANPTAIANQYSITLIEALPDNSFVLYEAASESQADTVAMAMGGNPSILSVQIQASRPEPNQLPGKGGTLPVVGDRSTLQIENASLLSLINWQSALANGQGREVRVAVLDTGISDTQLALWSKVVASYNFVEPNLLAIDRPQGTDSDFDGFADEAVGHGTMVAGIIDFVAPQTKLIIGRVADSDGAASTWNVVRGIRFAIENGAEVINLSLATATRNRMIGRAIAYAERKGAVVVAGIGNAGIADAFYPAKLSDAIAVTAVSSNGTKSAFSNWHSRADVAAPGFSILSDSGNGQLDQWSGTSFAAAFVSGTIADCLRRRGVTSPDTVRRALKQSGRDINDLNPNFRNKIGVLVDHAALDAKLND
jgi:subtilisin family serine protease